ncbi:MAG: ATP-binding protein [Candidatus Wallbacteria bacterium]|nr:ATP-binding protein [Candidatus Wallbacteria bacterium]
MYIPQQQLSNLQKLISPQKAILIYGPRRCGKTTLITEFLKGVDEKYLFVNGDDIYVREFLSSQSIEKLKSFVGDNKLLAIDEAQRIKGIGLNLKIILDHIPDLRVIASGSSSFDLCREAGEPLTGRKITLQLFPLAQLEIGRLETKAESAALLEDRLVFGSYPEIVLAKSHEHKTRLLKELIGSYLLKDILELDGIKNSDKILRLLQLIVFQIGREVSLSEIGRQLSLSKNTVDRYMELLERTFVIFRITGFSRNLRKEITKSHRFYFLDNGVRNALINNFNPLNFRDDTGMLWENYIVTERMKRREYTGIMANSYFWRTYEQHEIDLVEESGGMLHAYEIKWSGGKKGNSVAWLSAYPDSEYQIVSRENYLSFITQKDP